MSFVTHAENKDASAFKSLTEETLAGKVVQVLDGLKAVVAAQFFNEEGGVSGGVSSVKKMPAPESDGSTKLPGKDGAKTFKNSEKSGEARLSSGPAPDRKGFKE